MESYELLAPAKVNIGLDVIKRREDGYHEVDMIMQTISLFDKIAIKKTSKAGIHLSANKNFLPVDERNIAYKAAKLLIQDCGITDGVDITIEKNIPVAAGMAGGSTDAAAVLMGMNELFALGLSEEKLMEKGAALGADVPFCIMRGTARATGIGTTLTRISPMPNCSVLIAKPNFSVSTKWVYEHLKLTAQTKHPDIEKLISEIEKKDILTIAGYMENVLESVTVPAYPKIAEIRKQMTECGAVKAMMSGSGPTVFGLFTQEETAKKALRLMREYQPDAEVCLAELTA